MRRVLNKISRHSSFLSSPSRVCWISRRTKLTILPRTNVQSNQQLGLNASNDSPALQMTNPKTPLQYIAEVPPIEVDGLTAVCDGGSSFSSHPIEYIQLNKINMKQPETCKYCGLRFIAKQHH